MVRPTPQQQLDGFIDKFTPSIAAQMRTAMSRMLARLPGAVVLVYDNYNALAVGFGPSERTSDAIFSLAVYPRWISLFFLKNGLALPDPLHLLKGSGKVVRHIVLDAAETFDHPAVMSLMDAALELTDRRIDPTQPPRLIIKSVSAKQRPRRPAG
ncbi:MAG: hypothetical protein ABI790_09670 [Betaproteobacteria bacterium]